FYLILIFFTYTITMESSRKITLEELKAQDGVDGHDLWVLIHGKVYDMTKFKHPGGKDILMDEIGEDREDEFDSIHSPAAKAEMKKLYIGDFFKEEKKANNTKHKKTDGDVTNPNEKGSTNTIIISLLLIFIFGGYALFTLLYGDSATT